MSVENKIERLSSLSKGIIGICVVIISAGMAYYRTFDNEAAIKQLRLDFLKEIEILQIELEKDHNILQSRADKRHGRSVDKSVDHEIRIRQIESQINYIKGKEGY